MDNQQESKYDTLVFAAHDSRLVFAYSLVLSAVDIPHHINCITPDHYEIYVEEHQFPQAKKEITTYINENRNWPPAPPAEDGFRPTFLAMSPVIISIIIYIFNLSGNWNNHSLWFTRGAGDANAILDNLELYRLITPLTLHADIVHLLGNCFLGGILLHFLLHITGNGIGLIIILISAVTANYINVIIHGHDHYFVGFSTAVFAIIGMLCTISLTRQNKHTTLHFFIPLMAGFALLALLGSGGKRTDLGAHLFGLLCGFVSGGVVLLPCYETMRRSFTIQTVLGITFFATVYLAWYSAFQQ